DKDREETFLLLINNRLKNIMLVQCVLTIALALAFNE
ncbi:MAG: hypothetical protein ACI90V_005984, partial [Bacillariaceae sp.]